MSKAQISRLEALLDRVRARAGEPRVAHVAAAAPAPVAEHAAPQLDEPVEDLESTQQRAVPMRTSPAHTDADIVMEVEVQAATQDTVLAVPAEDVAIPEATESRERLVAAEPIPEPVPELVAEPVAAVAVVERVPGVPEEPEAAPEIIASVEDVVEEAPISSRRPVAPQPEERLAEMAFGSEEPQPARHTPPPESGRLPAAPDVEFEGDVTGVRDASKAPEVPPRRMEIVPEATVAHLKPSDAVADMVGQARAPSPSTFVAVLDASIAL